MYRKLERDNQFLVFDLCTNILAIFLGLLINCKINLIINSFKNKIITNKLKLMKIEINNN